MLCHCQALGPPIKALAEWTDQKSSLVKVNTGDYPDLMQWFRIRGTCAVKVVHKWEVVAVFCGARPKLQIEKWLENNLLSEEKLALAAIKKQLNGNPENLEALQRSYQHILG